MKKIIILTAFIFSTAICSNIFAQVAAPAGAGDKDLRDDNIRTRSIDLERVDRDAKKSDSTTTDNTTTEKTEASAEDKLAMKYADIKTDYEQMQMSEDAIIKAYQGSGAIDYAKISSSAMEINKSAMRLHSNLFTATEETDANIDDKENKEVKLVKSVRDLIIDLDGSIGSFVTSPMFQNLRTVDPAVSEKAQSALDKIIELSEMLGAGAGKKAAK